MYTDIVKINVDLQHDWGYIFDVSFTKGSKGFETYSPAFDILYRGIPMFFYSYGNRIYGEITTSRIILNSSGASFISGTRCIERNRWMIYSSPDTKMSMFSYILEFMNALDTYLEICICNEPDSEDEGL